MQPSRCRRPIRRTGQTGGRQPAMSAVLLLLVAMAGGDGGGLPVGEAEARMSGSMVRHRYVMHNGLGPEYAGLSNPLRASAENVQAGKRLYQAICVACHGEDGRGDGPAAAGLDPAPGNVARAAKMPMASDGYLFWTLSEGGQALGTQMPAFGESLEEAQIWQLILYLRAL